MKCVVILLLLLTWGFAFSDRFSGSVETCHKKISWVLSLVKVSSTFLGLATWQNSLVLFTPQPWVNYPVTCDTTSTLQSLAYKPKFFFYSKLAIYSTQASLSYHLSCFVLKLLETVICTHCFYFSSSKAKKRALLIYWFFFTDINNDQIE